MRSDFYGTRISPPTKSLAAHFGSSEEPVRLEGGKGTSYISGNIVLKPADNEEIANWIADLFSALPSSIDVRFARPIRSVLGTWVHDGYVAWSFLQGEHVDGEYETKLSASRAFHDLLKDVRKPAFLDAPINSWSAADMAVWSRLEATYDKEFSRLIDQITLHLEPLNLPSQLVHGDLSGNFLLAGDLPPAIIDFSPAWAPNGFAEGVMFGDVISWEGAPFESLSPFKRITNIEQFAWRGILRRILEQTQHIKWLGKDKGQAVKDAAAYQRAIEFLSMF